MQFHHHPDGLLFLRTKSGIYSDTIKNFEADFGAIYEGLPDGVLERQYEPGKWHIYFTLNHAQIAAPFPWPVGDLYIAAYDRLVSAQQARMRMQS